MRACSPTRAVSLARFVPSRSAAGITTTPGRVDDGARFLEDARLARGLDLAGRRATIAGSTVGVVGGEGSCRRLPRSGRIPDFGGASPRQHAYAETTSRPTRIGKGLPEIVHCVLGPRRGSALCADPGL